MEVAIGSEVSGIRDGTATAGAHVLMEGTYWRGMDVYLKWWGCVIEWCTRWGLGPKSKTELPRLGFDERIVGGLIFRWRGPIWAGVMCN